jgi:hypothetical protein
MYILTGGSGPVSIPELIFCSDAHEGSVYCSVTINGIDSSIWSGNYGDSLSIELTMSLFAVGTQGNFQDATGDYDFTQITTANGGIAQLVPVESTTVAEPTSFLLAGLGTVALLGRRTQKRGLHR